MLMWLFRRDKQNLVAGIVMWLVILGSIWLLVTQAYQLIPGFVLSALAALFAICAVSFTMERFRLDLFDRRFEIYQAILTYCSVVQQLGGLRGGNDRQEEIEMALENAQQSFRGIGLHKSKALFGKEISELCDQLNKDYAMILTYQDIQNHPDQVANYWASVIRTAELTDDLPEIFEPYISFADFRTK